MIGVVDVRPDMRRVPLALLAVFAAVTKFVSLASWASWDFWLSVVRFAHGIRAASIAISAFPAGT